jgi:hypothetical protein
MLTLAANLRIVFRSSRCLSTSLVVRARRDTTDLAAIIRNVVRDPDPSRSGNRVLGTASLHSVSFPAQVATVALGPFGVLDSCLLSITGTFGLASYTVSKRLRELSIRVELGAQAKQILSAALGRMLILLASGSIVGCCLI